MGERGPSPFEKPPPHRGPLHRAAKKAALAAGFVAALSGSQLAEAAGPERAPITETIPPTPEADRQELLTRLFKN